MRTEESDFLKWVSDPARTNEELFTVEIMLEGCRSFQWPHDYVENGWEGRSKRGRERQLNPAYRPALHLDELRTLIGALEQRKMFAGAFGEDRPLRDLSALRFFPFLENVSVQSSDVTDFSPLASLRRVIYLSIAEYGDLYGQHPISLAQCGEMSMLERLHLALRHPWPDLRGMANWPKLQDIVYNGSVLALEEVPVLPAARVVQLKSWVGNGIELRDLTRLPLMPMVRQLTIHRTSSLAGIERYPSALNLELAGCYRDLTPLARMENVTALKLIGERFQDLRPLAEMKNLRELVLEREWPIDLAPLAECAQLRRVDFQNSAMMRTEVAALNAVLLPEAADFRAPAPRPLQPLKFYLIAKNSPGEKHFLARTTEEFATRTAYYDGDVVMLKAWQRAFETTMQAKFDELLGRGWGTFEMSFTHLKRYKDTTRLRELVDLVREYQAGSLHPPRITLVVEPHGDMTEELEQMKAREEKEAAPDEDFLLTAVTEEEELEEDAEWRRNRKERYEVLKREHLFKLRAGEEAAAQLNLPNEEPEPEEPEEEVEDEPLSEANDEGEGEGGVAIAPPPPPPKGEETTDLSESLMFYLDVWEDCVTATSHWAPRAAYCLGADFVEWTPPQPAPYVRKRAKK